MYEVRLFEHPKFGTLRFIEDENGKLLFCGKDVASALGYTDKAQAIRKHCKGVVEMTTPTTGGIQTMKFVPEGDVYRLAAHSRLPEAVEFESWVFDEMVPSVVKHGAYMTDATLERVINDPDWGIGLLNALKAEKEKVRHLETQIKDDRPKVEFAKQISFSSDTISVGELAKLLNKNGIDTGRDRLFKWLRANGYLTSTGKHRNIPTQKSVNLGVLTLNETSYLKKDGTHGIGFTPRVTVKGQEYFLKIFLKGKK